MAKAEAESSRVEVNCPAVGDQNYYPALLAFFRQLSSNFLLAERIP